MNPHAATTENLVRIAKIAMKNQEKHVRHLEERRKKLMEELDALDNLLINEQHLLKQAQGYVASL